MGFGCKEHMCGGTGDFCPCCKVQQIGWNISDKYEYELNRSDVLWLVDRVKVLTEVLEFIKGKSWDQSKNANDWNKYYQELAAAALNETGPKPE